MMQIKNFFQSKGFQRLLILGFLALVLYRLKSMIHLILITFILIFLMDRFQKFISRKLDRFFRLIGKSLSPFIHCISKWDCHYIV